MEPFKPEVTGFPSLGVNEDHQEEPREIMQEMLLTRDGAAGEAGAEFAPQPAAVATQVKGEGDRGGDQNDGGDGDSKGDSNDEDNSDSDQEDGGDGNSDGDEGAGELGAGGPLPAGLETHEVGCGRSPPPPLEREEPKQEGQDAVQGPERPRSQHAGPRRLNQQQVRELESFFQRNQYPNAIMRQELARVIEVPAARVQGWFKKRRAKLRRQQREQTNMPPVPMAPPVVLNVAQPYHAIFVQEPGPVRMPQEPVMPGPPRPPMQPFPPVFLPPPVWIPPALPNYVYAVAPCGCRVAYPPYGHPLPLPPRGYLPVAHPGFQPPSDPH